MSGRLMQVIFATSLIFLTSCDIFTSGDGQPEQHDLLVSAAGNGAGAVGSVPGDVACSYSGTGTSGTCSASFASGTIVTLTATAASGHTFTGWSGTCTGTGSCQVTMNQERTVTATFALPIYPLTVASGGAGNGSVASSPAGITCTISGGGASGACNAPYTSGTPVTLTAIPAGGHTFTGWSGACTGTGSCQVTMSQARTVIATFTPLYPLTVAGGGTGSGSVTSSPAGITCTISGGGASGACNAPYTSGTPVTLTATPAGGHAFTGWSGACTGTGSCQVSMSQARTVSASFAAPYALTVAGGGTGSGSVTSSPAGITCTISTGSASGTCNGLYTSGTPVTLTATPAGGHTFTGWSGACTGTGSCQVTMSQARTVTATFALPTFPLAVAGGGTGSGSVTSSPSGITCTISGGGASGACNAPYTSGTPVTLTATAAGGHTFTGWSGACTGTGSCQVTMSQARTVTATFTVLYQLTVVGRGTGAGSVSSSPNRITCTISGGSRSGTCNAPYTSGTVVTLTAAPISSHTFAGWTGACTGTGSCLVTMSQARTVTATFNIGQQIAVPAYFDEAPGDWNTLRPEVTPSNVVVINPNNGPGIGYTSRINEVHARGGRVLGYVYTKYANTKLDSVRNPNGALDRMVDSVKADIDRYYSLYPNLDGIFLDEVTTDCSNARSYYKPIYDYITRAHPGATVIVNPGTAVNPCYLDVAHIVVTFESTFANYQNQWSAVDRGWETPANSTRIWHIVHTTNSSDWRTALTLSRSRSAGHVYVTSFTETDNTFGQLPQYFHDEAVNVRAYKTASP